MTGPSHRSRERYAALGKFESDDGRMTIAIHKDGSVSVQVAPSPPPYQPRPLPRSFATFRANRETARDIFRFLDDHTQENDATVG